MTRYYDKDIAMMQQAKCNVMSVGIFSWAKLEPREGVFNFAWLDIILDKLYAPAIHVFLATPSGARPAGCRSAIRRFCGWGAIGCRPCTAAVTTTVCRHRSIARKPCNQYPAGRTLFLTPGGAGLAYFQRIWR
ncbi:beta-galactosidase [Klebsiella pneumoniae]|uniref:Beta-galactosidase n=1 Tax=Klebsiella pneumoniae TaxID=573 RepID=A0A4P0XVD2_KLEPN|nr:beta-galactosidase [Klebsiella pneumoniae]